MERFTPCRERRAARTAYRAVHVAHHGEHILIEAKDDVQPVLFDAVGTRTIATAGALAAEAPSHLVDGHLVLLAQLGSRAEPVGGRHPRRTASDDRDFLSRLGSVAHADAGSLARVARALAQRSA